MKNNSYMKPTLISFKDWANKDENCQDGHKADTKCVDGSYANRYRGPSGNACWDGAGGNVRKPW